MVEALKQTTLQFGLENIANSVKPILSKPADKPVVQDPSLMSWEKLITYLSDNIINYESNKGKSLQARFEKGSETLAHINSRRGSCKLSEIDTLNEVIDYISTHKLRSHVQTNFRTGVLNEQTVDAVYNAVRKFRDREYNSFFQLSSELTSGFNEQIGSLVSISNGNYSRKGTTNYNADMRSWKNRFEAMNMLADSISSSDNIVSLHDLDNVRHSIRMLETNDYLKRVNNKELETAKQETIAKLKKLYRSAEGYFSVRIGDLNAARVQKAREDDYSSIRKFATSIFKRK
jgi:hypothetical protein